MSILLERIQLLCDINGIKVNAVENGAEITRGSIRNWGESIPSCDKILRVANFFDVSTDYLLGNSDNPESHKVADKSLPAAAKIATIVQENTQKINDKVKLTLEFYGLDVK